MRAIAALGVFALLAVGVAPPAAAAPASAGKTHSSKSFRMDSRRCHQRPHRRCAKHRPEPKAKAHKKKKKPLALPARTGVDEGEYYLYPTRAVVAAGVVELDPVNLGMDEHNLTIEDSHGRALGLVTVQPGQTQTIHARLARGSYRLFCSLYNHAALGMSSTLTVR
jgi:plastocyanin